MDVDIIAQGISVGGDVAYTVGIELGEAYVVGQAEPRVVALRGTTLYRWEAARWKSIHRHADRLIQSSRRPDDAPHVGEGGNAMTFTTIT